jgi:CO/xanthine dehydrogenase Mo-binding subunit
MTALLTRRDFARAAAGLVVVFSLAPEWAVAQGAAPPALPGSLNSNRRLDAWIRIDPEGTVTVFTGKCELGQGAVTALAQIAADELDVAFTRIRMIAADTAKTPDEGFTSGSQSMEFSGTAIRLAAAQARRILLDLAQRQFGADGAAVSPTVEDGTISGPGGKSVTYWALARDASLAVEVDPKSPTKPPAQYRVIGQSIPRLDIPAKLTGGPIYVQDMRLAGTLFGRVVRPQGYGAQLVSADEVEARKLPGVIAVVRDGSFLGVVAEREEQAISARDALHLSSKWNPGKPLPEFDKIHAYLKSLPSEDHVISEKDGPAPDASTKVLSAEYTRPYITHGSIGPSCAVAQFSGDRLQVWSHCQGVFPLRRDLAKALKMPEDRITVSQVQGSGCYGHNGADDVALDAALLARAANGRPVKVQWMRDDEFHWEPYGAAMSMRTEAALDGNGRIVDWSYDVWSNTHSTRPGERDGVNLLAAWYLATPMTPASPPIIPQPAGGGDRNAIPLYQFPRQKVTHHFIKEMPLRVSALRTLGAYANVFAIESFMDELARAAGADPIEFRHVHLNDPRAKAVINLAAKNANWVKGAKGSDGRGRGIGFAQYKNHATYVAVIADVETDRSAGAIKVVRATAAVDAGQIVNPDGLKNQMEGGIIQSGAGPSRNRCVSAPRASPPRTGRPIRS